MRLSASGLRRSLSTAAGSSTGTYSSLFATQSDLYKLYRPTYPDDLFATILSFHRTRGNGATTFAVDLAAGSGQATEKLGALFSLAVGVDESEQQIKQAKPTPSVEYRLGSAESCPAIDDRSADLVTVAQAFHWFDHLNFYREAHRILQPRGTLAIWSYSMGAPLLGPDLSASLPATTVSRVNDRLKSTFLETYSVILGPYWDAKRQLVDQEYVGLEPSKIAPSLYENETRARSLISLNMPLASVASYVQTWSAHASFLKAHVEVKRNSDEDPATQLLRKLSDVLIETGVADGPSTASSTQVTMEWPVSIILATKKG